MQAKLVTMSRDTHELDFNLQKRRMSSSPRNTSLIRILLQYLYRILCGIFRLYCSQMSHVHQHLE
jgi:hypothetical protein